MEAKTKQRLVGGLVLVAATVIFLPLLFHHSRPATSKPLRLSVEVPTAPDKPQVELQLPPAVARQSVNAIERRSDKHDSFAAARQAGANVHSAHSIAHDVAEATHKELKSKKLAVAIPKAEKPDAHTHLSQPPQAWSLQVASFADSKNANRLVKNLRGKGFDVYARKSQAGHKTITRVFVGPLISLRQVKQLQRKLHQQHLAGVIKKYH